jgi:hypothetical protein
MMSDLGDIRIRTLPFGRAFDHGLMAASAVGGRHPTIYMGDCNERTVADVLSHEVIHIWLHYQVSPQASEALDAYVWGGHIPQPRKKTGRRKQR